MITVYESVLPGVKLIERSLTFDHRGFYAEVYNEQEYFEKGINIKWVQDNFTFSQKNVLRGLHGDNKTWKLVSCVLGKLFFVVINYDSGSKFFGKHLSYILTPQNRLQVLVPPGHGIGHLVLNNSAILYYKQSEYYHGAQNQFVIPWNDSRFNIPWPVSNPVLSTRDKGVSV